MLQKKVQVVVFDLSGEIPKVLLLKTNKSRGSFWQNITGSLHSKESTLSAAKRELFEETGLVPNEIFDLDYYFEYGDFVEQVFGAVLSTTPKKIKLDPKEHDDFKWVEASKISKADYKYQSNFESFIIANMRIKI
jgi:dATP pyrophosphohydrolase